jgi:hypothetical protein
MCAGTAEATLSAGHLGNADTGSVAMVMAGRGSADAALLLNCQQGLWSIITIRKICTFLGFQICLCLCKFCDFFSRAMLKSVMDKALQATAT